MKIKELIIDVKRSKNYQTYGCSEVITLEQDDDVEQVKKESFERCNINCLYQIANEGNVVGPPKPFKTGQKENPIVEKILTTVKKKPFVKVE